MTAINDQALPPPPEGLLDLPNGLPEQLPKRPRHGRRREPIQRQPLALPAEPWTFVFGAGETGEVSMVPARIRIQRLPGMSLRLVAELTFSNASYERVFQPLIADMQEEYLEALAKERPWKAWFTRLLGYVSFGHAVATMVPVEILRKGLNSEPKRVDRPNLPKPDHKLA